MVNYKVAVLVETMSVAVKEKSYMPNGVLGGTYSTSPVIVRPAGAELPAAIV